MNALNKFKSQQFKLPNSLGHWWPQAGPGNTVLITNSYCVDLIGLNSSPSSLVTTCMALGKLLNLLASIVFCNISFIILVTYLEVILYAVINEITYEEFSTGPGIKQTPNKD